MLEKVLILKQNNEIQLIILKYGFLFGFWKQYLTQILFKNRDLI